MTKSHLRYIVSVVVMKTLKNIALWTLLATVLTVCLWTICGIHSGFVIRLAPELSIEHRFTAMDLLIGPCWAIALQMVTHWKKHFVPSMGIYLAYGYLGGGLVVAVLLGFVYGLITLAVTLPGVIGLYCISYLWYPYRAMVVALRQCLEKVVNAADPPAVLPIPTAPPAEQKDPTPC